MQYSLTNLAFFQGLIKIRGERLDMHELPLSGIPASISDICIAYVYIYIFADSTYSPNPLSYYLHQTPEPLHKIETLTNHVVELACPFLLLLPRPLGSVGGLIQILFQARALSDH